MRKLALVVLALTVTVPAGAADAKAHHKATICERAYNARVKVIHHLGKRAPGRNICRYGIVVGRSTATRASTTKERWEYYQQLLRLAHPAPLYLIRHAALPTHRPAGVMSSSYSATGVAACIVSRESGGNPLAVNGQYEGIAQWSPEAWGRMGGTRYSSTPLGATYQEQLRVLSYGLAHYGTGDWKPYDGCG